MQVSNANAQLISFQRVNTQTLSGNGGESTVTLKAPVNRCFSDSALITDNLGLKAQVICFAIPRVKMSWWRHQRTLAQSWGNCQAR